MSLHVSTWCFLAILFIGCSKPAPARKDHWLEGAWTARAFQGRIDEYWSVSDSSGFLTGRGFYIEGPDTTYREVVVIDSTNVVTLIARPAGGDIMRFPLKSFRGDSAIFENRALRNPFRLSYKQLDKDQFRRQIEGYEAPDSVRFVFLFSRIAGSTGPQQ